MNNTNTMALFFDDSSWTNFQAELNKIGLDSESVVKVLLGTAKQCPYDLHIKETIRNLVFAQKLLDTSTVGLSQIFERLSNS